MLGFACNIHSLTGTNLRVKFKYAYCDTKELGHSRTELSAKSRDVPSNEGFKQLNWFQFHNSGNLLVPFQIGKADIDAL